MDEAALRHAYTKTALHRLGITFERAVAIEGVRIAMEGSARRASPQPVRDKRARADRRIAA